MILEILGIICMGILFVDSEPLVKLKRLIGFKEEQYFNWGEPKKFIYRLLTCVMCSTFWIGLIITGNIYIAAITSVSADIINKIMIKL